jgi:hypothetical protein
VFALRILLLEDSEATQALLHTLANSGTEPLVEHPAYSLGKIVSVVHEKFVLETLGNILADLYQQYAAMSNALHGPFTTQLRFYFGGQLDILADATVYLAQCAAQLSD